MKNALRIFRKDVWRLWPAIALVVCAEVLNHCAAAALSAGLIRAKPAFALIGALAQFFLIALAIHAETPAGDRQYWVTKPCSWKTVALAKCLFFAAFINLPVLAVDVITLIARGQPVVANAPALLLSQFSTCAYVVLIAALASVSATMMQFMWTVLASYLAFVVVMEVIGFNRAMDIDWGELEWLQSVVMWAITALAMAAVLWIQYARRDTRLSRRVLAVTILCVPLMLFMPGWHAAFAAQRYFSRPNAAEAAIRIAPDSSRKIGAGWGGTSRPGQHATAEWFPVVVSGIPPGMVLYSDKVAVRAVAPDGRVWNSGWDSLNDLTGGSGQIDGRFRKIASDGPYWLYVNLDPSVASPRCLRAELALTLLSEESVTPLPRGAGTRVAAGGRCWAYGDHTQVSCSWPPGAPENAVARFWYTPRDKGQEDGSGFPPAGEPSDTPLISYIGGDGGYAFFGTGDVWKVTGPGAHTTGVPRIEIVSRRAVAHFERTVDFEMGGGSHLP